MEAYIRRVMSAHHAAGLAVGIAQAGRPDRFLTFGYQDLEAELPVTTETRFGAASLTKSMTAVAIMQLQERGLLKVQDPLVRYLPEFRTPDDATTKQITLHHLLTHTAGFPPLPTLGAIQAGEVSTVAGMLAYLGELEYELLGPPGAAFSYGNETIALLGAVIERVSGTPYAAYMDANLFGPAGLTATDFGSPEGSRLYNPGESGPVDAGPWTDSGPFTPARAVVTTITDLLRYTELFRTGGLIGGVRLLSKESVQTMMEPWVREPDGDHYGYCLMVTPVYGGERLVEHVGAMRGVSAWISILPEQGAAIVVLANTSGVAVERIARAGIDDLLGLPPHPEPETIDLGPSALLEYAGQYEDGSVRVAGAHLELESVGPLFPVAPDRFVLRERENRMSATFLRNSNGAIDSLFFGMRLLRRLDGDQ